MPSSHLSDEIRPSAGCWARSTDTASRGHVRGGGDVIWKIDAFAACGTDDAAASLIGMDFSLVVLSATRPVAFAFRRMRTVSSHARAVVEAHIIYLWPVADAIRFLLANRSADVKINIR